MYIMVLYGGTREQTEMNPTSQWTLRRAQGAADGRFCSLNDGYGGDKTNEEQGRKTPMRSKADVAARYKAKPRTHPSLRARMKKPIQPLKKRDQTHWLFPFLFSSQEKPVLSLAIDLPQPRSLHHRACF